MPVLYFILVIKSYIFKGGPFHEPYWLPWAPLRYLSKFCVHI